MVACFSLARGNSALPGNNLESLLMARSTWSTLRRCYKQPGFCVVTSTTLQLYGCLLHCLSTAPHAASSSTLISMLDRSVSRVSPRVALASPGRPPGDDVSVYNQRGRHVRDEPDWLSPARFGTREGCALLLAILLFSLACSEYLKPVSAEAVAVANANGSAPARSPKWTCLFWTISTNGPAHC